MGIIYLTNPFCNFISLGDENSTDILRHGRLITWWDMLKRSADEYIALGRELEAMSLCFYMMEESEDKGGLRPDETESLNKTLKELHKHCNTLELVVASEQITMALTNPPKTRQALEYLVSGILAELKSRLFLFFPTQSAKWYECETLLNETGRQRFPRAYAEIRHAGNCIAFELYDGAVFHSMRALEHGLRATATQLNVSFPFPIELAEWQNIIEKIESEVRAMKALAKSPQKDADTQFYSEAATQFMYFKDAWRNHVSHVRTVYNQSQAVEVLEHVGKFIGRISERVAELP
jgi:hypothetical protein